MNNISVNSIDNLINYDFKHANTDFDYENAVFNTYKERQLKDITTDTFIENMFSDKRPKQDDDGSEKVRENNRFNFLAYVYTYLNLKIKLELPTLLIEDNIILKPGEDVYLLFKGGNMMYYKYEELKSHVKPILQTDFFKLFDESFKVSDFDFTCYITVKDRERFYKVKKIVNQILWKGTVKVRDFFENYINISLDNAVDQNEQDNKVFKLNELNITNFKNEKETRIPNIKNELFNGVNTTVPQDEFDIILNRAMKITENDVLIQNIDQQQIRSTLYYLRSYLYRKIIYHKTPEKLSEHFHNEYENKNEEMRSVIVLMWEKISKYINDIKINDDNEYINIVTNNHIVTLLDIYEFLVFVDKYKNVIFDRINQILLTQQRNFLSKFLQRYVQDFELIYQQRIVESDLYNIFTISTLLKNIKQKFDEKKNTLKVCETVYDEYLSFDEDTNKLKDERNFNFIDLKDKELDVYMQKREDFYIQPSLFGSNTMYTDTSTSSFHYVYQNSTIKKLRNQSSSVVDFDLLRVKFMVNLAIGGEEKPVNVPSEFIDISICNYDDSALTEFRNHTEDGLGLFTIKNDKLTLECYGYSIDFMVHDLIHVLYEQNLFTPWVDAKYDKRIKRLNALQMLSCVGDDISMRYYMLSLLVIFIIVSYSEVYVIGQGKIDKNDDMQRLFSNLRDNIKLNYKKYDLERVFNILPTTMMDIIYRTYLQGYENDMIQYPDQLIGSVIFYSILQQHFYQETNNNDNKQQIKDIINRYRNDFLFLPADSSDIENTMKESRKYVVTMGDTFSQMLDLVKEQATLTGGEAMKQQTTKKQYTFF
jgi:hypothetical protein